MIENFHFIRPVWFLALLPVVLLWGLLRRGMNKAQSWRKIVAPHLLPHLLSGTDSHAHVGPLNLALIGWVTAVTAIAGPAWRREPGLFADETRTMAIVLKVSPSMTTEDVQPSRLARAAEKIHDLLAARAGAKTSLIAYAGTAHVVMPATVDGNIIDSFAQALDPKIMPEDGDAAAEALRLAEQTLVENDGGLILWITDSVAPTEGAALAAWRKSAKAPMRVLAPVPRGPELNALEAAVRPLGAKLVNLSADDSDVRGIARLAKYSTLSTGNVNNRWEEGGRWLAPLLAALTLPCFRRGWMIWSSAR